MEPVGYGYGLGYFAYDPYMFGGGYPYGGGAGYGGPGGGGYGYGSGSGSYSTSRGGEVGSIRLKVKPSNAQVYVDGYYVGVDRQLRRQLPAPRHRGWVRTRSKSAPKDTRRRSSK